MCTAGTRTSISCVCKLFKMLLTNMAVQLVLFFPYLPAPTVLFLQFVSISLNVKTLKTTQCTLFKNEHWCTVQLCKAYRADRPVNERRVRGS